jgi:hypothetical protein
MGIRLAAEVSGAFAKLLRQPRTDATRLDGPKLLMTLPMNLIITVSLKEKRFWPLDAGSL